MERILLLNDSQYPNGFNSGACHSTNRYDKNFLYRNRMLAAINQYNPKLGVSKIEYMGIETQFPNYKKELQTEY